jgi:hypothetical protein
MGRSDAKPSLESSPAGERNTRSGSANTGPAERVQVINNNCIFIGVGHVLPSSLGGTLLMFDEEKAEPNCKQIRTEKAGAKVDKVKK